jgi:hypothetical protein
MTEALGLSIEYVNWIDSELHAISAVPTMMRNLPAFLSAIWEVLPHKFTESASAQTFLRTRARDLKYGLRALPHVRCIITAAPDQKDRAAGVRRRAIRDTAAGLSNAQVDWPTAEAELRRRYPDVTEDELLEAIKILFIPYCVESAPLA